MPRDAFEDAWDKETERFVWVRCLRSLDNAREDAEDLLSDIRLRAMRGYSSFKGRHEAVDQAGFHRIFRSWVLKITNNEIIRYRERRRRRRALEAELSEDIAAPQDKPPLSSPAPPRAGGSTAAAVDSWDSLLSHAHAMEQITGDMARVIRARTRDPRPTWEQVGAELGLGAAYCAVLYGRGVLAFRTYLFLYRPDLLGGEEPIQEAFVAARPQLDSAEAEAFQRRVLERNRTYRRSGWRKALERACTRIIGSLDRENSFLFSVVPRDPQVFRDNEHPNVQRAEDSGCGNHTPMDQETIHSSALIGYREMKRKLQTHSIFVSEVPTEHYTSLLLPTQRFGIPGYAGFASPARRMAGKMPLQGQPDRWWVLNAHNGQLLFYALTQIQPLLAAGVEGEAEIELPRPRLNIAQLRQLSNDLDEKLDQLAPDFFAGAGSGGASAEERHLTWQALQIYLPEPLLPHYMALAPDFFTWLSSGDLADGERGEL